MIHAGPDDPKFGPWHAQFIRNLACEFQRPWFSREIKSIARAYRVQVEQERRLFSQPILVPVEEMPGTVEADFLRPGGHPDHLDRSVGPRPPVAGQFE